MGFQPDLSFHALEQQLRLEPSAGQRAGFIDRYLRQMTYPILEDETTAVLLYHGAASEVHLIGDMTDWIDTVPFERLPGTDLWFCRKRYEPDARLEYLVQTGTDIPPLRDPLNPDAVHGFVLNSELAMPRVNRRPVFEPYRDGRTGSFERLTEALLPAGILPYPHMVHVYLPPGYADSARRYPAVYFQDGRDYVEYGIAAEVLHWLITHKAISPLIGVFVTPPNLHLPALPNRTTEYGMSEAYVHFFCEELVPWVDGRFRTVRPPTGRLVVGDSYGGLISACIACRRPDLFGMAYSQSGYFSFQSDRFIREVASGTRLQTRLFVDVGTYEHRVGRGFVPEEEGDFLSANRRFRDAASGISAELVYHEYHEGHTWGNWRAHLHDALVFFFH